MLTTEDASPNICVTTKREALFDFDIQLLAFVRVGSKDVGWGNHRQIEPTQLRDGVDIGIKDIRRFS